MRHLAGVLVLALGLPCTSEAGASELADTSWRLVEIVSMDDSVDAPDDRSNYTLDLRADGTAAMHADCNRGMGTWTSESASHLRFGPIAATRALCPPGSLSDKYLAQFEWVRSYVTKDGHLFLATMADGAIVEFEPAGRDRPAATVLGEELRSADAADMETAILTRLFGRFAAEQGIGVEAPELDAFVEALRRGMEAEGLTADADLTAEQADEADAMRRDMARTMIRQWKINKALYERYGGRIIYQQLGPEPLDAYRRFLEERQRAGTFTLHDPALAERFWRYFTDESLHEFMEPGGADEARAFSVPPWARSPGAE